MLQELQDDSLPQVAIAKNLEEVSMTQDVS